MLPTAILFDLDDTLFDHRRASAIALGAMHAAHAPDLPFESFATRHGELLEAFHSRYLAGELTLDEARVARMRALFALFGREIGPVQTGQAAHLYREQHQANRHLVTGARELLESLHGRCRLGIVTNNSVAEQTEKLRALNVSGYFDTVVISEAVGLAKPDPEIFAIALDRIGARPQDTVFIGDSWTNDIIGAQAAGMSTVWLDRRNQSPALTGIPGQKRPESRASAGVSMTNVVTLASLAPTASAIAAIKTAFTKRIPGEPTNEYLETLAT